MLEKETIKTYKERKIREEKAQQIQTAENASTPSVRKDAGELIVLTKANSFCKYVLTISRSMPKDFRFVVCATIQRLALSIVENLIRANNVNIQQKNPKAWQKRFDYQSQAYADLQMLEYIASYAYEQKAILKKQLIQISRQGAEVAHLIHAWKQSDMRRYANS